MDCRDNRQHRIRHQQVAPFYSGAMARIYSGVDTRAAAIQRRRRNARTILVHEPGLGGAVETDPGSQIDIVRDPHPWDHGCRDTDQGRRQVEPFHPQRRRACRHGNWRAGTVFHVRPGIATASSHRSALHDCGECLRHSPVAQFRQFRLIVQIGSVHGHPFQSADLFRFAPAKLTRFLPA